MSDIKNSCSNGGAIDIKIFPFPTFQEFQKRNSVVLKIGCYTAEIGIIAWGCNGCTKNTYCAEILGSNAECISRFTCEHDFKNGSIDELQAWYEVACIILNEKFAEHVKKTYMSA